MTFSPFAQILIAMGLAALYAGSLWAMMVVARQTDTLFLPQAYCFAISAVCAAFAAIWAQQGIQRPSLRAVQAAAALALLAFILPPVMTFQAARVLPSGLITLSFASLPLLALVGNRKIRGGFVYFIFAVGALAAFVVGSEELSALRGNTWLMAGLLLGGSVSYVLAFWLNKQLFWTFNNWQLGFWAMVLAVLAHLLMAFATGEKIEMVRVWPRVFWIYLTFFSVGSFGLGYFAYRVLVYRLSPTGFSVFSVALIAFGLQFGFLSWGETPLNLLTLVSSVAVLLGLVINGFRVNPALWMCHFLHSDIRNGERLRTNLEGFVRDEHDATGNARILDLSVGGMGIHTDLKLDAGQKVMVQIPLTGEADQIVLECQVAHLHPNKDPNGLPFVAGLRWAFTSQERTDDLVEFLARTGRAIE